MVEDRAHRILETLKSSFAMPKWSTATNDPFETLVATIISQNTTDRNTAKAFECLSSKFKVNPQTLADAEASQIERCLRVAGLHRNKAKAITLTSRILQDQFGGRLESILSLPFEEARCNLLQLPGVGPKTADVVLLFCAGKPTIPVDTHVCRVSKRLKLAPTAGDYEVVRASLQALYDQRDYYPVHVLLILHGRKYCKSRNPLCSHCPISKLCPSRKAWNKSG